MVDKKMLTMRSVTVKMRGMMALIVALFFLSDALAKEQERSFTLDTAAAARQLQALPMVEIVGNNGGPEFPLGLCQGDCDRDSDCQGPLVCFQRGARQSVPGCSGGNRDNSRGDYCVMPNAAEVDDAPNPGGGGGAGSAGSPSATEPFIMKLYWQPGYFWQEERIERKWCMKCRSGRCNVNNQIYIVHCDRERPTPLVFRNPGATTGSQIQISGGSNLCLERVGRSDIRLRRCGASAAQLWVAPRGGFSERRFEIAPIGDTSRCMTQRHHPRRGEVVQLEPCSQARGDQTSFWNRY